MVDNNTSIGLAVMAILLAVSALVFSVSISGIDGINGTNGTNGLNGVNGLNFNSTLPYVFLYNGTNGLNGFVLNQNVNTTGSPLFQALNVVGNIAINGTVDGVDVSELLLKNVKVSDLATIWDKTTKIGYSDTSFSNQNVLISSSPSFTGLTVSGGVLNLQDAAENHITFNDNTKLGYVGMSHANNNLVMGSIQGDIVLRSQTKILFTADGGSNIGLSLDSHMNVIIYNPLSTDYGNPTLLIKGVDTTITEQKIDNSRDVDFRQLNVAGSTLVDIRNGIITPSGYNSVDGTAGVTGNVAVLTALPSTFTTIHFKNGLYVG